MEGAQPQRPHAVAQHALQADAHFARGFVGEGHCQDVMWVYVLFMHQKSNALGEYARLTRARPGQNKDLAGGRCDGCVLLGVEFAEKFHRSCE
jgi:hypothetical protein